MDNKRNMVIGSAEDVGYTEKIGYMRRAMALAEQACGHTDPNPMVGCVIVKGGRIISEGYHHRCGEFHAERNALLNCREDPAGADLYVTLEPCCHYGKTPPCTEIILEKKIARVFVGAVDSNPLVGGKGIRILREHGVQVETGILEEECRRQNEVFFHFMEKKRPFVAMKYAMTLDGKIACAGGDSRWVTGAEARQHVHGLRNRYMGIMVGIGTVLADDPLLNCRIPGGRNPVRIVCDSKLQIPLDSQLVRTAEEYPLIVFAASGERASDVSSKTCNENKTTEEKQGAGVQQQVEEPAEQQTEKEEAPAEQQAEKEEGPAEQQTEKEEGPAEQQAEKVQQLARLGVRVRFTSGSKVNLPEMLTMLAEEKINGILLEGGGTLNSSFLEAGLVDRVYAYIAPKLVGGREAKTPVEGRGIRVMAKAASLEEAEVLRLGEDICITGRMLSSGAGEQEEAPATPVRDQRK